MVVIVTHRSCNTFFFMCIIHPYIDINLLIHLCLLFFSIFLPLPYLFQHFYHSGKINDFNLEEEAYDWTISQYPQLKKVVEKLTPFLRLYETVTDFLNEYERWLHGPLSGVNPDKVWALENYFIWSPQQSR